MALTLVPHHDGSRRYVPNSAPSLGETVALFLLVPSGNDVSSVHLRITRDGEPRWIEGVADRVTPEGTWWRTELRMHQPVMHYRFLVDGGPHGYRWVTALGLVEHDPTDRFDFSLSTFGSPPEWLADTVAYQIFLDRYARTGGPFESPDWAIPADWDTDVLADGRVAVRQLYGGDLPGIEAHLDHVASLGVSLLYLTPVFPARSSHRYDASSFHRVDPILGGDGALSSLVQAAHARGLRVIGDLTTNHTGDHHEWFTAAQQHHTAPEAAFYFFHDHPHDYEAWFGVRSLPKLDHRSHELRRRMLEGPDSVVGRWLRPPFDLDGWRVDVANMTGRHGEIDENAAVARAMRATMASVKPDTWLVAEHNYDASADLHGDGWHGTMNYAGFTRPVWSWLRVRPEVHLMGYPVALPSLPGGLVAAAMRESAASLPWPALAASLTLLDSHDTARFRTLVDGDRRRHEAGLGLLLTYPGVPMLFAGDEVGLEGADADDARRPMPWDEARWDHALLASVRRLVALRRSSDALARGALRWVHAGDDTLLYLRESATERLLVQVTRAAAPGSVLDATALGASHAEAMLDGPSLTARDGKLEVPGDGAPVQVWRLES